MNKNEFKNDMKKLLLKHGFDVEVVNGYSVFVASNVQVMIDY